MPMLDPPAPGQDHTTSTNTSDGYPCTSPLTGCVMPRRPGRSERCDLRAGGWS
jgi:hypothetical protein